MVGDRKSGTFNRSGCGYMSFLVRRVEAFLLVGIVGMCRMIIGFVEPEEWEVLSQRDTSHLSKAGSL